MGSIVLMTVENTSKGRSIGLLISYYVCLSFWVSFPMSGVVLGLNMAKGMRHNQPVTRIAQCGRADQEGVRGSNKLCLVGRRELRSAPSPIGLEVKFIDKAQLGRRCSWRGTPPDTL